MIAEVAPFPIDLGREVAVSCRVQSHVRQMVCASSRPAVADQQHGQWDAAAIGDHMVFGTLFNLRSWEPAGHITVNL